MQQQHSSCCAKFGIFVTRVFASLSPMKAIAIGFLLVLAACAPAAQPLDRQTLSSQTVIIDFKPDRGKDGAYKLGEFVRFEFTLERPGFVTLIAVNPDGSVEQLERNVRLTAGKQAFPLGSDKDASGRSAAYELYEPAGPHRMALLYTDTPGTSSVRFQGSRAADFASNVQTYLEKSKATTRDIAEITFQVTK
jgi:hypothetical protein